VNCPLSPAGFARCQVGSKEFGIRFPWNDFGAHGQQMGIADLAINRPVAVGFRPFNQLNKAKLRSVAFSGKHAFPKKHAADGYPIESTDQFAIMPSLERVGKSEIVQSDVRFDDVL
jgi:hypothetical protein